MEAKTIIIKNPSPRLNAFVEDVLRRKSERMERRRAFYEGELKREKRM